MTRDCRDKIEQYAAADLPKSWLFDPRPGQHRSDVFAFGPNGAYDPIPLDPDGRFASGVLPGFRLDPAWLWQDPLPMPGANFQRIEPAAR